MMWISMVFAAICAKLRKRMLMDHLWTKMDQELHWQQTFWFLIQLYFFEVYIYIYLYLYIYIYPSPNCLDICLCNPSTLDTASRVRWASMYRKREMRTGNVTDKHWQTSCVVFIVRISARPMRCPSAVSDWACRWGALASPWVVVVEGNYPNSSWMLKTSSAICMEPCILFDQSWFHVRRNDFQLWPNTFAASICELWAVRQNGCEPWRSQQCLLGMSWWRCHWS